MLQLTKPPSNKHKTCMIETIHTFGYIGIFINLVLEIGLLIFPLPADSLLFASGILVEAGKLNIYILLPTVIVASTLAGHIGYFLGERFGKDRLLNNKFFPIDTKHFHKTEKFFAKYGALAIIASRFVPMIRTFISPTLGIIAYDKHKFAIYNFVASLIWSTSVIFAGIFIGKLFPNFIKYVELVVIFAVAIVALPLVHHAYKTTIKKVRHRKIEKKKQDAK